MMATYDAEIGSWVVATHSDARHVWLTERGTGRKVRLQRETAYFLGRALVKAAKFPAAEGGPQ